MKHLARLFLVLMVLFSFSNPADAEYIISGFLKDGDTYTTFSYPGNLMTYPSDINNSGEIVGTYYVSYFDGRVTDNIGHGFLKDGNTFASIDYPSAFQTNANGINDKGEIVGYYYENKDRTIYHGFVKDGNTFSSFDYPGAKSTMASGINNVGQIVGAYLDSSSTPHGFVKDGNTFSSFDYPGSRVSGISAINDRGIMVGSYIGGIGWYHGFVKDGNTFSSFDYPGATGSGTGPEDINNPGQIVGRYEAPRPGEFDYFGFLKDGNSFVSIDLPNIHFIEDDEFITRTTYATVASGINDSSEVTGFAYVSYSVPEPSTMLLLGSGLLGLVAFRKKFRK